MHIPVCIASVDKRFSYHTLQLMTRGSVRLVYDDRVHNLRDGWLWQCQPGPRIRFHEWPRGQAWNHRYIAFTGPRIAEWKAEGLWFAEPQPTGENQANSLAAVFDEVIALSRQPDVRSHRRAVNVLERMLLDHSEHRTAAQPVPHGWLEKVMRSLAQLDAEPNYTDLAAQHDMSLTSLRRRFRQATATSLHHYRLSCRVAAARGLLGDTDLPIKRIAMNLGYRDVFYFTRQFRQHVGMSPNAYRKSRQR